MRELHEFAQRLRIRLEFDDEVPPNALVYALGAWIRAADHRLRFERVKRRALEQRVHDAELYADVAARNYQFLAIPCRVQKPQPISAQRNFVDVMHVPYCVPLYLGS